MTRAAAPALVVLPDAPAVAEHAARLLAEWLAKRLEHAPRATFAVSGGRTPIEMLQRLAASALPWDRLDLFQVDERIAPAGHPDRNATELGAVLARHAAHVRLMPVEAEDIVAGARGYAALLGRLAGEPPTLDAVHLGIGADGHTASLFPGEPLERHALVALTGPHLGRARMTLTLPVLNRARRILWVVTGADKRAVLARLLAGDPELVASQVRRSDAWIVADAAAAAQV